MNREKKLIGSAVVAAAVLLAPAIAGQTVLTRGHTDIGVGFSGGAFDLHVHDGEADLEFEPDEVILQVGPASLQLVPANASYAFLGNPGDPFYVLPQVENPDLLFLGISGEELDPDVFSGDRVTFSLRAIDGPGDFWLYQVDSFGNPTVFMNSRDGSSDSVFVNAGSHREYNWAFSAPGDYTLTFEATGELLGGGIVSSGLVEYQFQVIPEPSTVVLGLFGGLALMALIRRRK